MPSVLSRAKPAPPLPKRPQAKPCHCGCPSPALSSDGSGDPACPLPPALRPGPLPPPGPRGGSYLHRHLLPGPRRTESAQRPPSQFLIPRFLLPRFQLAGAGAGPRGRGGRRRPAARWAAASPAGRKATETEGRRGPGKNGCVESSPRPGPPGPGQRPGTGEAPKGAGSGGPAQGQASGRAPEAVGSGVAPEEEGGAPAAGLPALWIP